MIIFLVTIPLLIKFMGLERYGLWILLTSIGNVAMLLDSGLTGTSMFFVSKISVICSFFPSVLPHVSSALYCLQPEFNIMPLRVSANAAFTELIVLNLYLGLFDSFSDQSTSSVFIVA